MLFTKKAKKFIGIAALTCFLTVPISYTLNSAYASAAPNNQVQFEQRHNPTHDKKNNDKKPLPIRKNDKDKKDKVAPPPPKQDNRRNDRIDKNPPPPSPKPSGRYDGKNPPPPPPPRYDHDNDKDYDKGDITAAVLVGGVIGAVIANNT